MRLTPGILAALLLFPAPDVASALEPVTALDDGFAVPSPLTMPEASVCWPGSEAFTGGPFAVIAWTAPYGMRDLSVTTASAGTRAGNAALSASWSGTDFDLYGDDREKIGVAYAFGEWLALGARMSRNAMRIEGFGTASTLGADAGIVLRPVGTVALAASFENLTGAEIGDSREPVDGRSRASVSWSIPGSFTLLASVAKTRRTEMSLSSGVIVEAAPELLFGVLGANEPDRAEFLAVVGRAGLRFSYRGSFHRDLGFTHGFSVGWNGARESDKER